jgi:hypothetical protein
VSVMRSVGLILAASSDRLEHKSRVVRLSGGGWKPPPILWDT